MSQRPFSEASPRAGSRQVSRRALVSGTAWAVPAVIVASAAPAVAASPQAFFTGKACRQTNPAGSTTFFFQVSFPSLSSTQPTTYSPVSMVVFGSNENPPFPMTITVPPGQTSVLQTVRATEEHPGSSGPVTLTYRINNAETDGIGRSFSALPTTCDIPTR